MPTPPRRARSEDRQGNSTKRRDGAGQRGSLEYLATENRLGGNQFSERTNGLPGERELFAQPELARVRPSGRRITGGRAGRAVARLHRSIVGDDRVVHVGGKRIEGGRRRRSEAAEHRRLIR